MPNDRVRKSTRTLKRVSPRRQCYFEFSRGGARLRYVRQNDPLREKSYHSGSPDTFPWTRACSPVCLPSESSFFLLLVWPGNAGKRKQDSSLEGASCIAYLTRRSHRRGPEGSELLQTEERTDSGGGRTGGSHTAVEAVDIPQPRSPLSTS